MNETTIASAISTYELEKSQALLKKLEKSIASRIYGKSDFIRSLIEALLLKSHVLIEGVPGLAKTKAVRTLSASLGLSFSRIQFTPDLLPSDLTGTLIYDQHSLSFKAHKGPLFANIILADEINRAPAKVQSALLEAMEERQITLGDGSHKLPDPFFVLATQNPIEHEGTYPLPEAELDRFLYKILLDYPTEAEEKAIVLAHTVLDEPLKEQVISSSDLEFLSSLVDRVVCDDGLVDYIVRLVRATRPGKENIKENVLREFDKSIEFGASPRASIALYRASKAHALLLGRPYVMPDDVKACTRACLRHRIVLSYEALAEDLTIEDVLGRLLSIVRLP